MKVRKDFGKSWYFRLFLTRRNKDFPDIYISLA